MSWVTVSDIHGQHRELLGGLEAVDISFKEPKLIFLGDYVDRGPDSKEVLATIKYYVDQGHVAILGNHDLFLREFLKGKYLEFPFTFGKETIDSFIGHSVIDEDGARYARERILAEYPWVLPFLESLPYYHEEDGIVFIHGGYNPYRKDWKQSTPVEMTMPVWPMHAHAHDQQQPFISGHFPVMNLHRGTHHHQPLLVNKHLFIDGGNVFGGKLNFFASTGDYFQLDADTIQAKRHHEWRHAIYGTTD